MNVTDIAYSVGYVVGFIFVFLIIIYIAVALFKRIRSKKDMLASRLPDGANSPARDKDVKKKSISSHM